MLEFNRMRHTPLSLLSAALLLIALSACRGLPSDFESLPLEQKVDAYTEHLQSYGRPKISAQSQIARHGAEAASLMADYLNGKKQGLPPGEALEIINRVQTGGCPLKGTPAEEAVERFLAREPADSADALLGRVTLDAIRTNAGRPRGSGALQGDPCGAKGST
jgi:hypothetical protein